MKDTHVWADSSQSDQRNCLRDDALPEVSAVLPPAVMRGGTQVPVSTRDMGPLVLARAFDTPVRIQVEALVSHLLASFPLPDVGDGPTALRHWSTLAEGEEQERQVAVIGVEVIPTALR